MSTTGKDSGMAPADTDIFIGRDTAADGKQEEAPAGGEGAVEPGRKRKLFFASGAILSTEFCERLAYYGLSTNMSLYLNQYMGYSVPEASQLLQVWKATVYLTPLLGAFLADAYLGRYWVIISFSCLYFVGMLGVTLVNVIPATKPQMLKPPQSGYNITRGVFWVMMYLVAIAAGGIKPCVSSFGADQFREDSARERKWRSSFFNWFYFSVNVGSLVATLVVVPVQVSLGYGIGFGIPTIAFAAAICIFAAVTPLYVRLPSEGSPLTRMYQVFAGAVRNKSQVVPNDPAELYEPADAKDVGVTFRMIHTDGMKCLDKAAMLPKGGVASKGHQCTVTQVEETKAFVRIMPIFLCVCIYQLAYDPILTFLPFPGNQMNRQMGSVEIPASSMSFADTFGVLFTVAFYDIVIVPLTTKFNRPISMTMRIGIGFFLEILALISAGIVETSRLSVNNKAGIPQAYTADPRPDCADVDGTPEADGGDGSCKYYTDPQYISPMSIWWQVIPYFLLGASEVFTNIGTMELFYVMVSPGMRSLGTAAYLLTICIGTYLAVALNLIIDGATGGTWEAANPIFARYNLYMWVNVGIAVFGLGVFCLVARGYVETPILDSDEEPSNTEAPADDDLGKSRSSLRKRKASRPSELREDSAMAESSTLDC